MKRGFRSWRSCKRKESSEASFQAHQTHRSEKIKHSPHKETVSTKHNTKLTSEEENASGKRELQEKQAKLPGKQTRCSLPKHITLRQEKSDLPQQRLTKQNVGVKRKPRTVLTRKWRFLSCSYANLLRTFGNGNPSSGGEVKNGGWWWWCFFLLFLSWFVSSVPEFLSLRLRLFKSLLCYGFGSVGGSK